MSEGPNIASSRQNCGYPVMHCFIEIATYNRSSPISFALDNKSKAGERKVWKLSFSKKRKVAFVKRFVRLSTMLVLIKLENL